MALEEKLEHPIILTEGAAAQIAAVAEQDPPSLRVAVRGGGCSGFEYSLDFDGPRKNDTTYEMHGVRINVDPVSLRYLEGTTIDYKSDLMAAGFVFNNPQAKGQCGCGQSFTPYDER